MANIESWAKKCVGYPALLWRFHTHMCSKFFSKMRTPQAAEVLVVLGYCRQVDTDPLTPPLFSSDLFSQIFAYCCVLFYVWTQVRIGIVAVMSEPRLCLSTNTSTLIFDTQQNLWVMYICGITSYSPSRFSHRPTDQHTFMQCGETLSSKVNHFLSPATLLCLERSNTTPHQFQCLFFYFQEGVVSTSHVRASGSPITLACLATWRGWWTLRGLFLLAAGMRCLLYTLVDLFVLLVSILKLRRAEAFCNSACCKCRVVGGLVRRVFYFWVGCSSLMLRAVRRKEWHNNAQWYEEEYTAGVWKWIHSWSMRMNAQLEYEDEYTAGVWGW